MTKTKAAYQRSKGSFVGAEDATSPVPITLVRKGESDRDLRRLSDPQRMWLAATGFDESAGKVGLIPASDGTLAAVAFGLGQQGDQDIGPLALGSLPAVVPAGDYVLANEPADPGLAAIAWAMGSYQFDRYKSSNKTGARRLVRPKGPAPAEVDAIVEAVTLGRDLINTPASDLGPEELEAAARDLAATHGADFSSISGDRLLDENFPMIHAVGRASTRAPRLVDIRWGRASDPKVTLVGKGICFDTGGLNIKPGESMALMKKDMGGAAAVLALGHMIMSTGVRVRLRLLLPIAENAIAGNAFRPGDVLSSRDGMTVEIGNTDAEGRLVLADAIALGSEERPDVMMTFATLTGAARVALGPDLPPLYTDDDALAGDVMATGLALGDPVWRMPFWMPYDKLLKSHVADVNHISGGAFAGSLTAALFLKRFVKDVPCFAHFDIFGWTPEAKPGKPKGGEPQGARAVFEVLKKRYG